jgi:uncharacterized protein (DUF433 family)
MSLGTTMAAKYRARANTLTKKERKEYRTQAMSAIHGALKKTDLLKRTKKAKPRLIRDPSSGLTITKGHAPARVWHWRIILDPEILGGVPVFFGTRVPVKKLTDFVWNGGTIEDFPFHFPGVREDTS